MSKVCELVEWGFANILSPLSFLHFMAGMKLFQSPTAKYYVISAFLLCCKLFYVSQNMDSFDSEVLSHDQYFVLID